MVMVVTMMARDITVVAVAGIVVLLLTSSSTIALAARTDQTSIATASPQNTTALTVTAEDLDGYHLRGIPLVFSHKGNVTIEDTPVTMNISSNIHNYTVSAPNFFSRDYANATFLYWKQGKDNDRTKTISIAGDGSSNSNVENLTGVYRFRGSIITVPPMGMPPGLAPGLGINITDSEGNLIKGVRVAFSFQNRTVFTSHISGPTIWDTYFWLLRNETTYVVSLPTTIVSNNSSSNNSDKTTTYHFSHWEGIDGYYFQDRDKTNILITQINHDWAFMWYEVRLTAVYSKE
jgi:hypothetical protein